MLEAATEQLATITGQRPSVRRARKSIAQFKVREGMPVGVAVTLRGERSLRVPRPADVGRDPADPRLPRAQPALVRRPRQLLAGRPRADHLPRGRLRRDRSGPRPRHHDHDEAASDEEAFALLEALGMPFSKEGRQEAAATRIRRRTWPRFHNASASSGRPSTRPGLHPLPPLRPRARRVPQVRRVPDLPARARAQRLHPRNDEVELVTPMSMTDPIADFLTRLRNAAKAQHQDVTIPSSRLKRELARILKEQGYIEGYEIHPAGRGPPRRGDRGHAQVHRRPQAGDHRDPARLAPRAGARTSITPTSRGSRAGWAPRSSRPRKGVMTGHEARQRGRRRRGRSAGLVDPEQAMSRIGKQPIPVPAGVTVAIEPERVTVNGPKGELSEQHPPRHQGRAGRRARSSSRARPTAASTARCTG